MTIQVQNSQLEAKVNKVLAKLPTTLKRSNKEFVEHAIYSYIDQLVKETKLDKISLDEHNSIVIKPPSKQGRNINSSYYSNNNQHDYFQKRLV